MEHTHPTRTAARADLRAAGAYAVEVPEYHHSATGPSVTLTLCADCAGALPGGLWTAAAAPMPDEVCEQCGRRLEPCAAADPFAAILARFSRGGSAA